MLQYFDIIQFCCISSTFNFIKLSTTFLLYDFGQFYISLI